MTSQIACDSVNDLIQSIIKKAETLLSEPTDEGINASYFYEGPQFISEAHNCTSKVKDLIHSLREDIFDHFTKTRMADLCNIAF